MIIATQTGNTTKAYLTLPHSLSPVWQQPAISTGAGCGIIAGMETVFILVKGITFLVLLGQTLLFFLLFLRFIAWLRHSYQQAKHMRQQAESPGSGRNWGVPQWRLSGGGVESYGCSRLCDTRYYCSCRCRPNLWKLWGTTTPSERARGPTQRHGGSGLEPLDT